MLHVILFILKLVGWILLGILFLILLAAILLLFVPVRYRGILHDHDKLLVKGRISWLLHIISFTVTLKDGELEKRLKIFGIQYRKREKKPKKVHRQKEPKQQEDLVKDETVVEDISEADETTVRNTSEAEKSGNKIQDAAESFWDTQIIEDQEQPKEKLLDKWKRFLKMLYHLFHNIQYTIHAVYDKIKKTVRNIEKYVDLWQDEHTQSALTLLFGQLGTIFGHVKPRKLQIMLEIGTEDPATTGAILAGLGILYPLFEGGLHVNPHYDEAVFEADADLRGRMTGYVFLRTAWKLYFDKDVKAVLKMLKNREEL